MNDLLLRFDEDSIRNKAWRATSGTWIEEKEVFFWVSDPLKGG